eukprot:TRINITY_DN7079_c0_g1_i12.p1 TRINITY_DN7079_c0_g1~~TRINITY_DN7079_c0_g1_i12.p1  ORF type:complete len:315 (-),score=51.66 TRINITY_DN7079_c0_g1_i12:586-1470(-)
MGIAKEELSKTDLMPRETVIECIKILEKLKLIIPVGILQQRWVAHAHCRDWLIHACKLNRVRDTEKMESLKGRLYQGHGPSEETEIASSDGAAGIAGRIRKRRHSSGRSRSSVDSATGGEDISVGHREKYQADAIKVSHEVSEAVNKINWDDMEEVLVQIRPWVRIDGSLNRRVLDRLLGAVLGASMQCPGSLLSNLVARFSPALQPVHARELIHILTEIKAVSLVRMVKPKKAGLWSKPEPLKLEPFDILHDDSEVLVEPSVDAILLLGQFIGNKFYTTDFVCQCPCHPDRRM